MSVLPQSETVFSDACASQYNNDIISFYFEKKIAKLGRLRLIVFYQNHSDTVNRFLSTYPSFVSSG